jgi:SH3-like domain-containing protein
MAGNVSRAALLALAALGMMALAALGLPAARGSGQPAAAQAAAGAPEVARGPVSGAPLPRYVSLKGAEGSARRGPSRGHRIDWVFRHRGMPLRVTAEFEQWRRVEDADGIGGWVHYTALSAARTALVMRDMTPMHSQPRPGAEPVALLERGVVARILACEARFCRLQADGYRGWVDRRAIWGVDPHEWLD